MSMPHYSRALSAANWCCTALACLVVGVSQAADRDDLDAMRRDLEALKQGQAAMAADVADIKKLLESLRPPPPVRPVDGVLDIGSAAIKGDPQAALTIVEFSDFQCPFCKRHVDSTVPELEKQFVATGKVRYVFADFPLESIHPQAFKAAEASHCAAEQKKFWEMHDRMFAHQDTLAPESLVEHAKALGLDADKFKTCLDSGKYAEAIKASVAQGEKLGVSGTPAVVLGLSQGDQVKAVKLLVGSLPFAVFKEEIDQLMAGQGGKSGATGNAE
jgi:protein-disulfide isomerase